MIIKEIKAYGDTVFIGCDAKCEKAFGLNGRPAVQLSENENDYAFLSDSEVGIAPTSGKTAIVEEGSDTKPDANIPESLLNKWCFRECERCVVASSKDELTLPDYTKRLTNLKQVF